MTLIADGVHSRLLRAALNIKWYDRVTNTELFQRSRLCPITHKIQEKREQLVKKAIAHSIVPSDPQPVLQVLLWCPEATTRDKRHKIATFWEALELKAGKLISSDQWLVHLKSEVLAELKKAEEKRRKARGLLQKEERKRKT
jgi:hypothetical protein